MKLGDILRELLEQHNMTQKQFAQELDITPAALGNYIRNVREPDYHTLIRIADFFNVSIDFLLNHNIETQKTTHDEDILLNIFRSLSVEQRDLYLEQGKLLIRYSSKKRLSRLGIDDKNKTEIS